MPGANVEHAFNLFLLNPKRFMQTFFLRLIGAGTGRDSGLSVFTFQKNTVYAPMTFQGKEVEIFDVRVADADPNRVLQSGGDGDDMWLEFRAYYVAMKKAVAPTVGTALTGTYFTLPGTGGFDMMITSQLSGCTFGIGSQAANANSACTVSHIEPFDASATGNILLAQQTTALHSVDNPMRVIQHTLRGGAGVGYDVRAHVVGKRDTGGVWQFWAQKFNGITQIITSVDNL